MIAHVRIYYIIQTMEYTLDPVMQVQSDICKALSDPKRLAILHALRESELSVGELAGHIGCHMPNVSQHLAVLRSAGLVAVRRDGNVAYYSLANPRILDACDIIFEVISSNHIDRSATIGLS